MSALKILLFRKSNRDGTSKDWAIPLALDRQALAVYFGRTGSTLRMAETPANRCQNGSPLQEAEVRIREKEGKGYQDLGVFLLAANRRDLHPAPDVTASLLYREAVAMTAGELGDGDPAAPALYWRWRPTGGVETARRRARDVACAEIFARLAAVGWTLPGCSPEMRESSVIALWSSVTQDTDQGIIPLTEAQKPLIAFFLLLTRREIDLTVADEQGQVVTTWPPELPIADEILEELGLKPKDLNQLLTASGGGAWFF